MTRQEIAVRRWQLREEYASHILRASMNFRSNEHPRLKISKKEKLLVLAQIVYKKAVNNLTGE